ncbi:MAG: hypothetical protein HZB26_06445 [Candidatus Hydrogenedentes bacterium]|nr:hypothetical protein [Candidatus Hydrogenedentota bacterium]
MALTAQPYYVGTGLVPELYSGTYLSPKLCFLRLLSANSAGSAAIIAELRRLLVILNEVKNLPRTRP